MKPVVRNTLYLSASALALSGCADQQKEQTDEKERPNIIFIMSDDHAWQALSCYGSNRNETPNLDRLAEQGMRFTNSFVTNSISAPSRAVIMTGKYSHKNGVIDNQKRFDTSQVVFPRLLQKAGYNTAMIGKWHLKSEPVGFDYWKVLPGQGSYYNPDFIEMGERMQDTGYVTNLITDNVMSYLDTVDKEDPFCVMYQHKAPHRIWMPGPEQLDDFPGKEYPVPKTLFDDYENRKAAESALMNIGPNMYLSKDLKVKPENVRKKGLMPDKEKAYSYHTYEHRIGRLTESQRKAWDKAYEQRNREFMEKDLKGKELVKWKYQQYMQDYLACIASIDDNVGRLMQFLEEKGLDENTIVVYTSDQGFYLGEHGWYDKRFMYEESLKMPLIIKYPGAVKPGAEMDEIALNLDFAPTFLDYAGVDIPETMQGRSLRPLMEGNPPEDWRDGMYYHYYEYPAVHGVKRHYGIRTKRYKLIHFYYDIDKWEFYDLKKDSLEINNQIDNPEYQDKIEELKTRLQALRKQYGDSDSLSQKYIDRWLEKGNTENSF